MKKITFPEPTKKNCWFLENPDVAIAVDKATGLVRSLYFKRRKVDLFSIRRQNVPGHLGYVRVYDERDGRWYNDLLHRFRITRAAKRGNRIRFTKRFAGAPFVLDITLELSARALTWEVRANKANSKVADRSLRVGFNFPLQAGWHVWAPCANGEFAFDGMDDFCINHVQVSYVSPRETILPMVSHYSKDLDVGYSMFEPIEAKVPAAKFQFANGEKCFNWGCATKPAASMQTLEALNYYIGLVGKRTMTTQVKLIFHEGDWRPALGRIYKMYREYFDPDSPEIYDSEGVFHCGGVQVADDPAFYKRLGLKTLEVHGHFSHYSDYFQAGRDRWLSIRAMEALYRKWLGTVRQKDARGVWKWLQSHSDEEITAELASALETAGPHIGREIHHTRADIKRKLRKIARAGIHPFWYFNYTDGFRPIVEKRWPDAICRAADGSAMPSGWQMCHNMNADPSTSFGKFCERSIKKILAEYPELRGFFLDCFRHYEVDFAHDDGITVVEGRRAYSVNFSYDKLTRRIKKHMRATGRPMSLFANKPQTIRCMRHVDGVLLEGGGDVHEEKYFWACIAKPVFFMWTRDEFGTDENLRRAVLHGCFPKVPPEAFAGPGEYRKAVALYEKYLPLYEQFRQRVLCFEGDPLRVPKGARGKLYTVGRDYVAGIMTPTLDAGDCVRYGRTPYALFRVKRGWDIGKVGVMYPGDRKCRAVKFKFNGTIIAVPLADYNNCAVVKLFVTKSSAGRIGAEKFTGAIDSCGDPESSFQDISNR